jgi:ABC-2 type transport system permease protein
MKRFLPYLAVVSARYRTLLQYRAAAFAGLVTQCFWGALKLMILAAFYAASQQDQPMSLPEVVAYVWLGQAFFGMLPWTIDGEFAQKVRDGAIAYDLLRPVDLYALWYSYTLAYRTAPTTLRAIPLGLFAMLLLPHLGLAEWALGAPSSLVSFGLFVMSLVAAGALSTAITMLSQLSLLWTISAAGMDRIMPAFVTLLSGMVVPLPLFPNWLQPLLHWQPFRGLVDVPFRIYSGNIPPTAALLEIVYQGVWVGLLVWLGRVMLVRGTRKLVVQGG